MHESFIQEFKQFQADVFAINQSKGFNESDELLKTLQVKCPEAVDYFRNARNGLRLMLITSELGETLESIRKGNPPDSHIPQFSGFAAECADAIIRIMNMCTSEGEPLAEAIVAKSEYNRLREYKHGGKRF